MLDLNSCLKTCLSMLKHFLSSLSSVARKRMVHLQSLIVAHHMELQNVSCYKSDHVFKHLCCTCSTKTFKALSRV